jgi:DNA repair protein RadC
MTRRRGKRPKRPQPPQSTDPPLIRHLPPDERPRQRLLRSGPHSLSDAEILSILIGNGCREVCSLALAREILDEGDGLFGLVGIDAERLQRRGLGTAKAASVIASLELARRLAHAEIPKRAPMNSALAVVRYLILKYAVRDQEVMGALFIDVRNRLMGEGEIFRGTLHRTTVEPREIFRQALLRGAAAVVLFHTHPSRDPSPSMEDLAFTRRMIEAGDAIGIKFQDHLVLGCTNRWVSLRERGVWR